MWATFSEFSLAAQIVSVLAILIPLLYWINLRRKKPRQTPLKMDWKPGVVYLYQFPPLATIVNISPFSLKLETWLRMANIPYEHVPCKLSTRSKEGLLPFVELDGVEYCDSAFVIRDLSKIFNIKESLTPEQEGAGRAFQILMEQNTMWSYAQIRYIEKMDILLSEEVLGFKLPLYLRIFQPALLMRRAVKKKLWYLGMGRHSRDEIINIGLDDLRAMSQYLGEKQFMMGSEATKLDCCLFAFLAQIIYVPIPAPHKDLIETGECENLLTYTERIKEKFWPDWNAVLKDRPVVF